MFKVMVAIQTFNGVIVRVAGQFGGADGLQAAESFRLYWAEQPRTLLSWVE
jgi:hypothetical protein